MHRRTPDAAGRRGALASTVFVSAILLGFTACAGQAPGGAAAPMGATGASIASAGGAGWTTIMPGSAQAAPRRAVVRRPAASNRRAPLTAPAPGIDVAPFPNTENVNPGGIPEAAPLPPATGPDFPAPTSPGIPAPDGNWSTPRGGTPVPRPGATPVTTPAVDFTFQFAHGDVMEIKVWGEPELTTSQRVLRDGTITPAILPPIQVAGRTIEDVRQDLIQRYNATNLIAEPAVSIRVVSVFQERAYILGEVTRPGAVELTGPTNVLQGIAQAGGFREEFANKDTVRIIRRGRNGRPIVITVAARRILRGAANHVRLYPGDIVYVHPTGLSNWSRQLNQILGPIAQALGVVGNAATTVLAIQESGNN